KIGHQIGKLFTRTPSSRALAGERPEFRPLLDTMPLHSLQFSGLTGQFHLAADGPPFGGQARSESIGMKAATRTLRQTAKREHIVGAASRVFAARPSHVVCMDDVAEAARVGKGTLYRYFPSKEDLYLGVVAGAFDLLIRRLERVEAEELPPGIALSRMIEAIVETFARHLPFFRLMQQGEARLFLRKRQVVRERRDRIAGGLARLLERGAQTGVFRKVDRE